MNQRITFEPPTPAWRGRRDDRWTMLLDLRPVAKVSRYDADQLEQALATAPIPGVVQPHAYDDLTSQPRAYDDLTSQPRAYDDLTPQPRAYDDLTSQPRSYTDLQVCQSWNDLYLEVERWMQHDPDSTYNAVASTLTLGDGDRVHFIILLDGDAPAVVASNRDNLVKLHGRTYRTVYGVVPNRHCDEVMAHMRPQ